MYRTSLLGYDHLQVIKDLVIMSASHNGGNEIELKTMFYFFLGSQNIYPTSYGGFECVLGDSTLTIIKKDTKETVLLIEEVEIFSLDDTLADKKANELLN